MARTLHTIVFRASMINDPEDIDAEGFIELEFEAWECAPAVRVIGGATTDANGYKTNDPKLIRRLIQIEFVKEASEGTYTDLTIETTPASSFRNLCKELAGDADSHSPAPMARAFTIYCILDSHAIVDAGRCGDGEREEDVGPAG